MTVSHGLKAQTSNLIPITLWDRVCSMPVVKSSTNVYLRSKGQSVLVGTSLEVIEHGIRLASASVKGVVSSVASAYPKKASHLESLAHDCLDQLEDKVPTLQHHASEVVVGTGRTFKRGIRGVLKSYPGQKVLQGLNTSIDVAELILESVQDVGVENRKYCSKGTQFTPDDFGGSKDRGSTSSLKPIKQAGVLAKNSDKTTSSTVILGVMKYPITVPLKIWIFILKSIKRTLVAVAGKKHRSTNALLSPDKMAMIKNRKRASPKKRVAISSTFQGLLGTIIHPIKVLFNAQPAKRDISLFIKPPLEGNEKHSINGDRHAEKRKHSDIDEDEEFSSTEETDEDIYGLDDYVSSEDSDFKPHNASTDSLEYASGDTESDIDTEEIGKNKKTGSPLRQIRKTPKTKSKTATQPATQDTKDNNQNSQCKGDKMAIVTLDTGKKLDLMGLYNNKDQKNKDQSKNKEQVNKA